jgi:hypothetical protein
MQKERTEQEHTAAAHYAGDLTEGIPKPSCRRFLQTPVPVRSRNYPQRSILRTAIVNVHTNSKQLLKKPHRCLDELLAFLQRPNSESRVFNPFLYRDTQILVKRHEPISVFGLIEEGTLNCNRRLRQRGADFRMALDPFDKLTTPSEFQEVSCARAGNRKVLERLLN